MRLHVLEDNDLARPPIEIPVVDFWKMKSALNGTSKRLWASARRSNECLTKPEP
jgi:hypothetical protein